MVNYGNGKIYKVEPICDHGDGDIYIGSTTKQHLSQRMSQHRSDFRRWTEVQQGKIMIFDLFNKYGIENCKICLIELVNATSKDELLSREKHYIQTMKCINQNIPLRSREEYREYKLKWDQNNQEKNQELKSAWYQKHRLQILQQVKIYSEQHKEKIKERKRQKLICECGNQYSYGGKKNHEKTKSHQEYMKTKVTEPDAEQ